MGPPPPSLLARSTHMLEALVCYGAYTHLHCQYLVLSEHLNCRWSDLSTAQYKPEGRDMHNESTDVCSKLYLLRIARGALFALAGV